MRRKEPKEDLWPSGLIMSSMARLPRCNVDWSKMECTKSLNLTVMMSRYLKLIGSMGLSSVPWQDCPGAVLIDHKCLECTIKLLLLRVKMKINHIDWAENPRMHKKAKIKGLSYQKHAHQVKSLMDGPGLLLDFHGQTHAGNRTELGYAVSSELNVVECFFYYFLSTGININKWVEWCWMWLLLTYPLRDEHQQWC